MVTVLYFYYYYYFYFLRGENAKHITNFTTKSIQTNVAMR